MALVLILGPVAVAQDAPSSSGSAAQAYDLRALTDKAATFLGDATEGLAKAIEQAFADYGRPTGYITGEEGGGAFLLGLRWGSGELHSKGQPPAPVHWSGPSIGLDFGANLSKVFILCYGLPSPDALFQRFPAVEGSLYMVGGVTVSYQQRDGTILAPVRTGAGLRAGANVGYLHYRREPSLNPF